MYKKLIIVGALIAGGIFAYKYSMPQNDIAKLEVNKEDVRPATSLTFLRVKGKVTIEKDGKVEDAVEGLAVNQNFKLKSYEDSFAILAYGKDFASKIKVGANSSFDLSKFDLDLPEQKDGFNFNLTSGNLLLNIFNPSKRKVLRVKTKTAAMGIRGTTFIVKAEEDNSFLLVKEGIVEIESDDDMKKATFAYADNAFSINSSQEVKAEAMGNFNINWDMESESSDFVSTQNHFSEKIDSILKNLEQKLISLDSEQREDKKELGKLEKSAALEFKILDKDNKCLSEGLENCSLESGIYTLALTNGTLPKNLITKKNIGVMLDEIVKRKGDVVDEISLAKEKIANLNLEYVNLKNKFTPANTKWNEFSSFDERKKEKLKKATYAEIVKIIDDIALNAEFEKIK